MNTNIHKGFYLQWFFDKAPLSAGGSIGGLFLLVKRYLDQFTGPPFLAKADHLSIPFFGGSHSGG